MTAQNLANFFTRSSAGWYFNSAGVLTQATSNEPRYDFDPVTKALRGLLIEEARTNLQIYSQDFANAAWAKSGVTLTPNAAVAPDGTTTMTKVVVNAGISTIVNDSQGGVARTPAVGASSTWCWTLYAKAAELNLLRLREAVSSGLRVLVNLTDGSVVYENGSSGNMTVSTANVGNGVWRITATRTTAPAETTQRVDIKPGIDTGDGVSGVYIWGSQLEQAAFPTSYIPTAAAQMARAVDTLNIATGAAWYNQVEGTLYAEYVAAAFPSSGVFGIVALDDRSNDNVLYLGTSGSAAVKAQSRTGAVIDADITGSVTVANVVVKAAVGIQLNNLALSVNGGAVVTDTTVLVPPASRLRLGNHFFGGPLNGWLRDIRYYPRRLSNAELQALTL